MIGLSQAVSAAPSGGASVDTQVEKAKRTILLYICGADLEEDCAMATYNLKQVMNAQFSADEDIKCVVMTGGSYEWYLDSEYLRDPDGLGFAVFEDTDEYTISGEYNQLWEAKGADDPDHPSTLTLLDADGDGEVNILDATTIQRYAVKMVALSEIALTLSDVDNDGNATIIDATWIQRYGAGMKAPEGIGKPIQTDV